MPSSDHHLKANYEKLENALLLTISRDSVQSIDNDISQMNHISETLLRKMEKISPFDGSLFTKLDASLFQAIMIIDDMLFSVHDIPLFINILLKTPIAKFTDIERATFNASLNKLIQKTRSAILYPTTMISHYKLIIFENYVKWINSLLSQSTEIIDPFLPPDAFESLFQYEISVSGIEKRTELDHLWGFIGIFLILSNCNSNQVSKYYLLAENQYHTFRIKYLSSVRISRYLLLIYHIISTFTIPVHQRLSCYYEYLVLLSVIDKSSSLYNYYDRIKYNMLMHFSNFLLTGCSNGQYSDWISVFSSVKGRLSTNMNDGFHFIQSMNYYEAIIFTRIQSFYIVSNNHNLDDVNLLLDSDMIMMLERLGRYDIICDLSECIIQRDKTRDTILLEQLYCICLIKQSKYHQAGIIASRILQRCHIELDPLTNNSDMVDLNEKLNNNNLTSLTDRFLIEYARMLLYVFYCPFEALQIASLVTNKNSLMHLIGIAWSELLSSTILNSSSIRNEIILWANNAFQTAINNYPFDPYCWYSLAMLKASIEHEYKEALDICRLIIDQFIDNDTRILEPFWCLGFLLSVYDQSSTEWIENINNSNSISMLWLKAKWLEYMNPYYGNDEHPAIHTYCDLLGILGRSLTSHVTFNPIMEEWNDKNSRKLSVLIQRTNIARNTDTMKNNAASIISNTSIGSSHSPYHHRTLMDYFVHPLFESWAMHRKQRILLAHFGHLEPDIYEFINQYRDIIPYRHKHEEDGFKDTVGMEYLLTIPRCLMHLLPTKPQTATSEYSKYYNLSMTPMLIAILWTDVCYFFIRQQRWTDAQYAIAEACYYDECNPFIQLAIGDWLIAAKNDYTLASTHYLLVLEMMDGIRVINGILLQAKLGALFGLVNTFNNMKDNQRSKYYLNIARECDPQNSQVIWWDSILNSNGSLDFMQLEQSIRLLGRSESFLFELTCFLPFHIER